MQPESLVIPLKQIGPDHARLTGNKAYNLSVLMQQHVVVPKGFCLTSQAYEQHISDNELQQLIQETSNSANPDHIGQALGHIRDTIMAAPLADSVGAIIATCCLFATANRAAYSATTVLPEPTSPCNSLFIG